MDENMPQNEPLLLPEGSPQTWYKPYLKKQYYMGAGLVFFLLIMAALFYRYALGEYNKKVLPILTEDTTFLMVFSSGSLLFDQLEWTVAMLADTAEIDAVEARRALSKLRESGGEQTGLVIRNGRKFWFTKNNARTIEAHDDNKVSRHDYEGESYEFIGRFNWEEKPIITSDYLFVKRDFFSLLKRVDAAMLWPDFSDGNKKLVYGAAFREGSVIRYDFSKDIERIGSELTSRSVPDAFAYLKIDEGFENEPLIPFSFARSTFVFPGELTVFKGGLDSFYSNPFSPELIWSSRTNADENRARRIVSSFVEELSAIYPLVESRLLPDQSRVFELKRERSQFLDHEFSAEGGIITYPQGQISYNLKDGVLMLKKGEIENNKTVENSCIIEGAGVIGMQKNSQAEIDMWKTMNFSYSKELFSICLS